MKFSSSTTINVTQDDIDHGMSNKGCQCPIYLGTARALGSQARYIHVDGSGISITRRHDYREKAFLNKRALEFLAYVDAGLKHMTKPFKFKVKWVKTTPVLKRDQEKVNQQRRERIAAGRQERNPRPKRVLGMRLSGEAARIVEKAMRQAS